MNAAVQRWGAVLQKKFGVPKVQPTAVENKLGYWTVSSLTQAVCGCASGLCGDLWVCSERLLAITQDNGGFYYGPEQLTTAKGKVLFEKLAAQEVPIGYTQL